jgi:hypothetical protein
VVVEEGDQFYGFSTTGFGATIFGGGYGTSVLSVRGGSSSGGSSQPTTTSQSGLEVVKVGQSIKGVWLFVLLSLKNQCGPI